jgi:hypothetical protein
MKRLSKLSIILSATFFGSFFMAQAATVFYSNQVGASPSNGLYLKTDGTNSTWSAVAGGSDPFTHPAVGQSATTSLMLFNGNATSSQLSTGTTWFTGITGVAGNCLHVDTNGKVSGMGADCGTAGGEANTGGSLGTGLNLYDSKSGVQLLFNTLAAGTNITLATDAKKVRAILQKQSQVTDEEVRFILQRFAESGAQQMVEAALAE